MQHDRGGISNQVRKTVLCSLNDSGITGYSSEKEVKLDSQFILPMIMNSK